MLRSCIYNYTYPYNTQYTLHNTHYTIHNTKYTIHWVVVWYRRDCTTSWVHHRLLVLWRHILFGTKFMVKYDTHFLFLCFLVIMSWNSSTNGRERESILFMWLSLSFAPMLQMCTVLQCLLLSLGTWPTLTWHVANFQRTSRDSSSFLCRHVIHVTRALWRQQLQMVVPSAVRAG